MKLLGVAQAKDARFLSKTDEEHRKLVLLVAQKMAVGPSPEDTAASSQNRPGPQVSGPSRLILVVLSLGDYPIHF
jgi:hypothetical protein